MNNINDALDLLGMLGFPSHSELHLWDKDRWEAMSYKLFYLIIGMKIGSEINRGQLKEIINKLDQLGE